MTNVSGRVFAITGGNGGVVLGMAEGNAAAGGYENDRFRTVTTQRTPARRWAEPGEFRPGEFRPGEFRPGEFR